MSLQYLRHTDSGDSLFFNHEKAMALIACFRPGIPLGELRLKVL